MKAKVVRGSGFRGALNYVFDDKKNAERVGGNLAGSTPRELSAELATVRRLRPDIERPVWHCSLSLPPGEHLNSEKWEAVASDFMQRMGFSEMTPWVAVRHQDTDKDHIHIVASRVSLDSQVWLGQHEVPRAIEATQELEKTHGLRLTPGYDGPKEQKTMTDRELNKAVRTGKEPTRQTLQGLLDEALKDKPGALELAERLTIAGVRVKANIASTGKMSGFSFELDGIAFKGSSLGKRYTWAGLQKAGVTYDQDRDRAGLERLRTADAPHGRVNEFDAGDSASAQGSGEVAGRSSDRDRASSGAAGESPSERSVSSHGLRQGDESSAREFVGDVRGDKLQDDKGVRGESSKSGRQPEGAHGGSREDRDSSEVRDRGLGQVASVQTAVAAVPDDARSRSDGRRVRGDWASGFRKASAARRNAAAHGGVGDRSMEQSHAGGARVVPEDRIKARELNPTAYLRAAGYTVQREGHQLSVRLGGDELYRITRKSDGHYVWCDRYGNKGGDNIALVQEVEGISGYAEAVWRLNSSRSVSAQLNIPVQQDDVIKRQPPKIPPATTFDRAKGRRYLEQRGISAETLDYAEKVGMLRYTAGAVLYVGYDRNGVAQSATRRAITASDPVQKRDLRGSDKSRPPILLGSPQIVWIVEGGADALALQDMVRRKGKEPPTVIVSGGAGVKSFLDQADVQELLKRADIVTVAGENEKDEATQLRTNAAHKKQAERVEAITGRKVYVWTPRPEQGKDLADMLTKLVRKSQEKAETVQKSRGSTLNR